MEHVAVTTAYGLEFRFPARDTAVGASLRDHGEFARPELDFLLDHAMAPAGTLLDVGAHIGAMALPFARARPGWRVIAVEAFGEMADLLTQAAAANGLANVEVRAVAAGAEAGLADFPAASITHSGNFGAIGFFTTEATAKRKVPVQPLDDIAPPDTGLIKIDVEGFEDQVLRGAACAIEQLRPIWVVEAHVRHDANNREIALRFAAAGYDLFWFWSPFATPAAPKGAPQNPGRGDMGLVALPRGTANRWNLPPADAALQRPTTLEAFPYLARYGY